MTKFTSVSKALAREMLGPPPPLLFADSLIQQLPSKTMAKTRIPYFMHYRQVLLLVWVPLTMAQVDREIDDPEDLLAVESFVNEVDLLRPIEPAPPGFGGQRLTQRQPTSARQDPGQGQKAAAMTTVQEYENVINEDGSYSFRLGL